MNKTNAATAIRPALTGAVIGFSISFLINDFLLPVADSQFSYAINNGTSGLFSGFFGGFFGLISYLKS